jgi:AsmA protein
LQAGETGLIARSTSTQKAAQKGGLFMVEVLNHPIHRTMVKPRNAPQRRNYNTYYCFYQFSSEASWITLPTTEDNVGARHGKAKHADRSVIMKFDLKEALQKRNVRIAAIVVGCIVVILIALPLFVDVNSFRPKVESVITSALGRPVTLGKLSLSIFSGAIRVDDVSIADDPKFSKEPFVTAKSLEVGVEVMPLIFSKELKITGLVLDQPQVTLIKEANGTWNFSSIGATGGKPAPAAEKSGDGSGTLSISKLEVKDGRVTLAKANATAKPQVFDKLNVTVKDFSFTSRFPFELTAGLPGGGTSEVSGEAGPINTTDASSTPFEAKMKIKELNLASSGFVDASSGIGGVVNFEGSVNSDGRQAKTNGQVTVEKFKFSAKGSPAPKDVTMNYAASADLAQQTGTVTQGDIAIGKAVAHLTGGYRTQGNDMQLNLRLNAPEMAVDELEPMLPALGVSLPKGSALKGGSLSADLGINGTPASLVITGPVRLSNTKLAGFDMGSKLGALSSFTGKTAGAPDTSIQNASLNARVAPEGTRADGINVTIPSLGTVTGAGSISPAGALDFKMQADLHGGMAGGLTQRAGLGGSNQPIPFSIEGTTSDPKFIPNVGGIAANAAKSALGNAVTEKTGGLGGLLGGKKKK